MNPRPSLPPLGAYVPRMTLLHRVDPRLKILSCMVLSLLIVAGDAPDLVFLSLFLLAGARGAALTPSRVIGTLKPLRLLLVLLFLAHVLFTPGKPLLPGLSLWEGPSREGLRTGLLVCWQFILLILSATLLTLTTAPTAMTEGLERLLKPLRFLKVPVTDLCVMLTLALRLLPTLREESRKIDTAHIARGAEASEGHPLKALRKFLRAVPPLMISGLRRVDHLAEAMEARAYRSGAPRTSLQDLRWNRRDSLATLWLGALLALFLARRVF